ncbi:hypothetical protein BDW59DRAFT_162832 [Aspergillus cavernicola]|uniref:Uncharacterized protein n=1 Tax=Aspergillus cavernicola TaxID=176166 RepID=A0ABR4I8K2_9EURO
MRTTSSYEDVAQKFNYLRSQLNHLEEDIEKLQVHSKMLGDSTVLATCSFELDLLKPTFNLTRGVSSNPYWTRRWDALGLRLEDLDRVLQDVNKAVRIRDEPERLIRPRLEAILESTLVHGKRASNLPSVLAQSMKHFQWQYQTRVEMTINYKNAERQLNGIVDFNLQWGSPENLETNLVVVMADSLGGASRARYQALLSMAMIHRARKDAGMRDCRVFGLGTDSYEFHFILIDNNSEYSWHIIHWDSDQHRVDIISRLTTIMRDAATLASTSPRDSNTAEKSVSEISGCITTELNPEEKKEKKLLSLSLV